MLTSNIFSNIFTYNLRTPSDFPIEAKNIIANKNIKNGITSIEHETLTTLHISAILLHQFELRVNCRLRSAVTTATTTE